MYSILLFVTKNKEQFLSNSQVHKINTSQTFDLYVPTANLTVYQTASITQELRFTIIYQQPSKICLMIRTNLS